MRLSSLSIVENITGLGNWASQENCSSIDDSDSYPEFRLHQFEQQAAIIIVHSSFSACRAWKDHLSWIAPDCNYGTPALSVVSCAFRVLLSLLCLFGLSFVVFLPPVLQFSLKVFGVNDVFSSRRLERRKCKLLLLWIVKHPFL